MTTTIPQSPISVATVSSLISSYNFSSSDTSTRLRGFVHSLMDVWQDLSPEQIFKLCPMVAKQLYDFNSSNKLADCINQMLAVEREFGDDTPEYWFAKAMTFSFMHISFKQINAEPMHILDMVTRGEGAATTFKESVKWYLDVLL